MSEQPTSPCRPTVVVVILNWNGAEHLRQFLPSVVAKSPSWVDIVVADNGSTDGSREVVEGEFSPRVGWMDLGRNWGFAEGYNRALETLSHEIFILLNSDVEVSDGWLEPLVEELTSSDDIAVVAPKLRSYTEPAKFEYAGAAGGYIDYLGYPFCRGRVLLDVEEDRGQYDDVRDVFWVSGAAFCCRSSVFREVGGFANDFFAHMEEIDLCWRFQLMGYRVRVVPRSVLYHLGGGTLSVGSPFKTKLNHRNNLAMLYRCAPTWQRVVVAVARPVLDFAAALSYLVQGRGDAAWAVAEAWVEFVGWHKRLNAQRHEIRSSRCSEARHIYRGSIVLKSLLKRKK